MDPSSFSPEEAAAAAAVRQLFEHCNHTELYQIARSVGFNVPPNTSKDALISIITFEKELSEEQQAAPHEIDEWRYAIMRFIIDHRRTLETQLTCPAKSFEEKACFNCIDQQVVHCLVSNGHENFKLIELRKTRRPS